MPLTFPSHAAAVLPVKRAWPRRWDGVALVVGSTAPDLPFAARPYLVVDTHTLPALAWFCLPVTLAGCQLVRRCGPVIAAHLPGCDGYLALGQARHRWYVTVWSALFGALTHLVWDSFTHPRATRIWPFLRLGRPGFRGIPWWSLLQLGSSAVGGLLAAAVLARLGRRPVPAGRYGPAPTVRRRPRLFWAVGALVALAALPAVLAGPDLTVRLLRGYLLCALALSAGAAAANWPAVARRVPLVHPRAVRAGVRPGPGARL